MDYYGADNDAADLEVSDEADDLDDDLGDGVLVPRKRKRVRSLEDLDQIGVIGTRGI